MNARLATMLFIAAALHTTCLSAQTRPTAKPSGSAPAAIAVASPIPGYEARQIEGFTLAFSPESLRHLDDAEYERKPLEVLQLELSTIAKLLRPEAVAILRAKVLTIVEWDMRETSSIGRSGTVLAFYAPGPPEQMVAEGRPAAASKNVTVCTLKRITEIRQPKRDAGGCVMLHEFTHAVHDRYYGSDYAPVMAVYRAALEKNLYDRASYLASNEKEFFACLTESYFDQGNEFPKTHADLKKHDPATFAFLEGVWGKRTGLPADAPKAAPAPEITLAEIDFGTAVLGGLPEASSLRGRPVLVVAWNTTKPAWILKANVWHNEMSDFGLTIIGLHLNGQGQPDDIKETSEARGVKFAVTQRSWRGGDLVKEFSDFPQSFVFDHTGKCTFGGAPFDAESAVRSAVTENLLAGLGTEPLPKAVAAVATQLRAGKTPPSVLPLLMSATRNPDVPTKEIAGTLLERITAGAERRLAEGEKLSTTDPVESFVLVNNLPNTYRGTTVASRAQALLAKIRRDKRVAVEFQAQPSLTEVYKIDGELMVRPGSFDPSLQRFQFENGALIRRLNQVVLQMRSTWPEARSTAEAVRLAQKYAPGGP
jgi:hypothetical protein